MALNPLTDRKKKKKEVVEETVEEEKPKANPKSREELDKTNPIPGGRRPTIPKESTPTESTPIENNRKLGESQRPDQPEFFRDETGKITGVNLPTGESFVGISPEDAKRLAGFHQEQRTIPQGLGEEVGATAERREQRQQAVGELEESGFFEAELPQEETELNPEKQTGEGIPFIGPAATAMTSTIANYLKGTFLKSFVGAKAELGDLIENPETQREILQQELQREVFDEALTGGEALGAVVENIRVLTELPFGIGDAINDLARTPSKRADAIVATITEVQGIASGMVDATSQGELGDPNKALKVIRGYQKQLDELEADFSYLTNISAKLRSNPESVDLVAVQIKAARTDLFEAEQRAAQGSVITPTAEHLHLRLLQAKNEVERGKIK